MSSNNNPVVSVMDSLITRFLEQSPDSNAVFFDLKDSQKPKIDRTRYNADQVVVTVIDSINDLYNHFESWLYEETPILFVFNFAGFRTPDVKDFLKLCEAELVDKPHAMIVTNTNILNCDNGLNRYYTTLIPFEQTLKLIERGIVPSWEDILNDVDDDPATVELFKDIHK